MSQKPEPLIAPPKPWLTWIMAALFGLGLLGWFIGPWSYQKARSIMATFYVQRAQSAMQAKEWAEASEAIAKARAWKSEHPRVLRATADFLKETQSDPTALLQTLRAMDEVGQATPEECLLIGQLLLGQGDLVGARAELARYQAQSKTAQETRPQLELAAGILRSEGHTAEADQMIRRALTLNIQEPESRLRLAILDFQASFPETRRAARATLWDIAQSQDELALKALNFLTGDEAELTVTEADQLLKLAESHAEASPELRYRILTAQLRLSPDKRPTILRAEKQRIQGKGSEKLSQMLNWLIAENEPTLVIELLPEELYRKSAQLLQPYLQALSLQQRWSEIDALLTKPAGMPVSPTFIALWRARAASKLDKDTRRLRQHLNLAFESAGAGQDAEATRAVAEVAEQASEWDIAVQCYTALADRYPQSQLTMLEKVLEIATRDRNTEAVLRAAQRISQLIPENAFHARRVLYLQLLLGTQIEHSAHLLENPKLPRDPTAENLLRALAAYRLGDLAQVRSVLPPPEDLGDLTAGQKAVHAGLLNLVGQVGPAFQLAERLPSPLLLPEELRFLKRAL